MSSSATVSYLSLQSCNVNLPGDLSTSIFNANIPPQKLVVELTWSAGISKTKTSAFVGWTGMPAKASGSLEIDATFARAIGLPERSRVSILAHFDPPTAHTVHLEPVSASDWEVVEANAGFLEARMINQVRGISLLHPLTVFPSPSVHANLQVNKIEPTPSGRFALLEPNSEVVVAPKMRKRRSLSSIPSTARSTLKKRDLPHVILRGVSLPHPLYKDLQEKAPLAVYTDTSKIPFSTEYASISILKTNTQPSQQQSNTGPATDLQDDAELKPTNTIVAKLCDYSGVPGHVAISSAVASALGKGHDIGAVYKIEMAQKPLSHLPKRVIVHPYSSKNTAASGKSLKLNGDSRLPSVPESLNALWQGPVTSRMRLDKSPALPEGALVVLEDAEGWVLKPERSKVVMGDALPPQHDASQILAWSSASEQQADRPLVAVDGLVEKVTSAAIFGTNTLLYGGKGSGKTSILAKVRDELMSQLVHVIWVNCSLLQNELIPAAREQVSKIIHEAAWHSPSTIIFDDIDKLVPAEQEHSDSTKSQVLSEIMIDAFESISRFRKVSIIGSSATTQSLNARVINSHLLDETVKLKAPDKENRQLLIDAIVKHLGIVIEDGDLSEVAGVTEGYQPADLWVLGERAHYMYHSGDLVDGATNNEILRDNVPSVFASALNGFTPSSLRGVSLHKSTVKWSDIGGLHGTKRVLLETLEWPTKYAPIFANCPLRLRSGILLYGYPGCGKTLIASAVAAECGLNFISVKGPEILNKYIGASEQSVRDLFERAQAAKPCILFFDEFDSIAPKRGHDSTGVTDRVVNQMLTQMDGAEGLDGVYVLAATSRPDLIDSALLRPGRFDKSLLCGMPDAEERVDILKAVRNNIRISDEVDLKAIADKTDGYSGADLQALLYNAYLAAVHETLEEAKKKKDKLDIINPKKSSNDQFEYLHFENGSIVELSASECAAIQTKFEKLIVDDQDEQTVDEGLSGAVEVKISNLEQSIRETKPSISAKERHKLDLIYKSFVQDRDGNMPSGTASNDVGGRVSLM